MADKVKKPLTMIAKGIEARGTAGSLRKAAGISGERKMTEADLDRMEAKARSMTVGSGKDKKMSPEGLKLFRKVQAARRFAAAKH